MARKIFLYICSVIALLALLCAVFPRKGINIGFTTLRFPSLHKMLYGSDNSANDTIDLASMLDSLSLEDSVESATEIEDSANISRMFCSVDSLWSPQDSLSFSFPNGNTHYFDPLFASMGNAKKDGRYIRILHYGDSQIEMDRMSSRLRHYFQRKFGGGGVGMMPFHPIIPTPSISHYCANELQRLAPFGDSTVARSRGNYGPMTQCFRIDGGASASFNAKKSPFGNIQRVAILYNNRGGKLNASLSCGKMRPENQSPQQHATVEMQEWRLDSAVASLRVSLQGSGDAYAVLLDGAPGVAVDNIPMRGCSGQQFVQIDSSLLAACYQMLDVGLIILQFGGNSVPYLKSDASIKGYCQSIGRQIDRIHQCCPDAKILFIGPSDMSTRIEGELQSYSGLEPLIEMLRRTANSHGAAFWSIYHAMGGHNSMVRWVADGLAGTDYIHFSPKGANIMGDRLAQAFERLRATAH